MTQTVGHYLEIYKHRKSMMERGVTHPSDVARDLINRLVSQLEKLDPNLPCQLANARDSENNVWYTFSVAGNDIASINIGPESGEIT